jgi:hypothetical protein
MHRRQLRKWGLVFLLIAVVGTAIGATQLLAKPEAAAPLPKESSPFVVHEWGTFTTFSGSDGQRLLFLPEGNDLPRFVYQSGQFNLLSKSPQPGSRSMLAMVSMETPVLYFYTEREQTVSVTADFPKGYMTEWYPQAQFQRGKDSATRRLTWKNVKLLPGAYVALPREAKRDNHYYAARETDAAPLEVAVNPELSEASEEHTTTDKEYEKFLFYRGVGTFDVPLQVSTSPRGQLTVKNTHKEPMAGVFLVSVKDGVLSFADLGSLKGGAETSASAPQQAPVSELADALAAVLAKQGLYEKEARAMVKTWNNAWFGEEGTRFLYILPAPVADELVPLQVQPRPDSLVRVFVGRHDILTRDREAQLDAVNRRLRSAHAAVQAAQEDLEKMKLGRFATPALTQSAARIAPAK